MTDLGSQLLTYSPRLLGALAIGVAGFFLAGIASRSTTYALARFRFDQVSERMGVATLLRESGIRRGPTRFAGALVFYAILILSALAALGPLGLNFLATALNQIILYAPRALAAVLSLVFGTAAAGLVAELTVRALEGVGVTRLSGIRTCIRISIVFIAAILAAAVLGLDVTILIAVTVVVLGAVALAAALAVGLGLRGLSQNIAASRYVAEGITEGDQISVNGFAGTVERIGHALTTVRAPDGRAYLIPNAYFLEHVVEKEGPGPTPEA